MRRALAIGISLLTFAVIAAAWELFVTYGGFSPKLVPGIPAIADAFVRLAGNGILEAAAVATKGLLRQLSEGRGKGQVFAHG